MVREPLLDGIPPVAALLARRIRRHHGGGDHLGPAFWSLSRGTRRGGPACVRHGPFLPCVPRGLFDLLHLSRARGRRGRSRARGIAIRHLLAERAFRGMRCWRDALPPSRHRPTQAVVPSPRARRRDDAVAGAEARLRSAWNPQSREARLVTVSLQPCDVASLALEVATLRRAGARITVGGEGDRASSG